MRNSGKMACPERFELPTFWFPPRRTLSSRSSFERLPQQDLELISTTAGFQISFTLHGRRSRLELLRVNNLPRRIMPSRSCYTKVVLSKPMWDIRRIARIQAARAQATQNTYMKYMKKWREDGAP
jgi:hypothetical protein